MADWLKDKQAAYETWQREQAEADNAHAAYLAFEQATVADGPDVSQYQGDIDWAALRNGGAGFAAIRASDGNDLDDRWSGARVASVRQTTLPWFPYHFGRCAAPENNERTGRQEAGMMIYFAQNAGWGQPGDLPLAYDFEKNPAPADSFLGQPNAKAAKHLIQVIKTYEWIMQHKPFVYSNPSTLRLLLPELSATDVATLAACPLWLADWTDPAEVPAPLTDYRIRQYTNSKAWPGIANPCDANRFNGSKTDLENLRIS